MSLLQTNKADSLAKASKELMLVEPFYGLFLMSLNKMWVTSPKPVPTAAVGLSGINYHLIINEGFWAPLKQKEQRGLLKHELLHIAFFHLTDFDHLADDEIANIAMDLEINQYIDSEWLPPGGQKLDMYPELNLEVKKGTKYYYDKLSAAKKNGTSPTLNSILEAMKSGSPTFVYGNGQTGNTPNHDTWDKFEELDDATKKLVKSQTEYVLKEVAQQVMKSRGTIPGELTEILKRMNEIEEAKFNWRAFLRRFIGGSTDVFTKKSRRKENVRFEDSPGLKVKPKRRILVAIDTSGSVSTDELKEFLNEIAHMHKTGTEVVIIQCDASIRSIGKFKPSEEFVIHGRGGTSFIPVTDYYDEHRDEFTCLIYLTDGEAPAPDKCKGPVLWVLSSKSHDNPELKGHRIQLN